MKVIEPKVLQIELSQEDIFKIRNSMRDSTKKKTGGCCVTEYQGPIYNVIDTINLIKGLINEAFALGRLYPY